jgi:predicted small metal-binding protein
MSDMHSTPDLPGTSPVTDNPNPGGTQGSEPAGPGTDIKSASSISGQQDSSAARSAGEPEGRVYFRCGDVGNADCRWETRGQTEDELRPRIHQHLREAHGQAWDDRMRSHIKDPARERAA